MKALTAFLIPFILCSCSDSPGTDNPSSVDMIDRYEKPVDAAGAAADQVQRVRDED